MSKAEAATLITWGKHWFIHVWAQKDDTKRATSRDKIIKHVNSLLNASGFQLGRGWQDYDPVIRKASGRPSSYQQLAS